MWLTASMPVWGAFTTLGFHTHIHTHPNLHTLMCAMHSTTYLQAKVEEQLGMGDKEAGGPEPETWLQALQPVQVGWGWLTHRAMCGSCLSLLLHMMVCLPLRS